MRQRRAFRPAQLDRLEDRVVLSAAAITANATTAYQVQTFDYAQTADAINTAFNAFRTNINNELSLFLNSATSNTPTTLSDLQTYATQQVGSLAQQIQSSLLQVPGATNGLEPFILNQVDGPYGGDLLSTINNIPSSSGTGTPSSLIAPIVNNALNTTQLAANDLLSTYAWGFAQGENTFGSATAPTPINYAAIAAQLNQSFSGFNSNYNSELNAFLNAGSGTPVTAAQLQANTTQQAMLLGQNVQGDLSTISGASLGLQPFILNQVNGTFGGDLVSSLNGLPTTSGTGGTVDSLYGMAAADTLNSAQLTANDLLSAYNWGLNQGDNYAALYTAGGNGNVIDQSNLTNALSSGQLAVDSQQLATIQAAYQTFSTAYNSAVQNTLDANPQTGANGSVNLSANQAAFNTQVGTAVQALNTSLANIYGTTNAASTTLLPSIQQSLVGSNGLQGQLAGLLLPTDLNGTSNSTFSTGSNSLITQSYLNTVASVNLFNLNNNFNFSTYASANSFLNGPYGTSFANYPTSAGGGFNTTAS